MPVKDSQGRTLIAGCLVINEDNKIYLLYKNDVKNFQLPGGKVDEEDCEDINNVTKEDLRQAALRELMEEVEGPFEIRKMEYLDNVEMQAHLGYLCDVHIFLTKIKGNPVPAENTFNKEKSGFYDVSDIDFLETDFSAKVLFDVVKKHFNQHYV